MSKYDKIEIKKEPQQSSVKLDKSSEQSERVKDFLRHSTSMFNTMIYIDKRFDNFNIEEQETILNNLQPYIHIKINSEKIEYIPDNLMNLEILEICECPNLKEIPKNLPKLRSLTIFFDMERSMYNEENLIHEIPKSLKNLKVLNLYHTVNKIEIPETVENLTLICCKNIYIDNLPNLKHLFINNLKELPKTLTTLTHLHLDMCDNLKEIPETLTNLKEIYIRGCNNLIIPNKIRTLPNIKIEQI